MGRRGIPPPPCFSKSAQVVAIEGLTGGVFFESLEVIENRKLAGSSISKSCRLCRAIRLDGDEAQVSSYEDYHNGTYAVKSFAAFVHSCRMMRKAPWSWAN
jgi:hypothetical protein